MILLQSNRPEQNFYDFKKLTLFEFIQSIKQTLQQY